MTRKAASSLEAITGYPSLVDIPDDQLARMAALVGGIAANLRREIIRRETSKLGGAKTFRGPDPKSGGKKK